MSMHDLLPTTEEQEEKGATFLENAFIKNFLINNGKKDENG